MQDLPHPNLNPFVSFMASWRGLQEFSIALKYALTCSTFHLVLGLVGNVSVGVLGGSQMPCSAAYPALADLFAPLPAESSGLSYLYAQVFDQENI